MENTNNGTVPQKELFKSHQLIKSHQLKAGIPSPTPVYKTICASRLQQFIKNSSVNRLGKKWSKTAS